MSNMGYFLLFLSLAQPTSAEFVSVKALLDEQGKSQTTLETIRLQRLGELATSARVGIALEIGDQLEGADGVQIELTCPKNTTIRVEKGPFKLLIHDPEDADCAVDLLKGSVHIIAPTRSRVNCAGVALVSEGTTFSVELELSLQKRAVALAVFDGQVRFTAAGIDPKLVSGGRHLAWQKVKSLKAPNNPTGDRPPTSGNGSGYDLLEEVEEASLIERAIDSSDTLIAAEIHARFEAVEAVNLDQTLQTEKVYQELNELYRRALRSGATEERLALVEAQVQLGLDSAAINTLKPLIPAPDLDRLNQLFRTKPRENLLKEFRYLLPVLQPSRSFELVRPDQSLSLGTVGLVRKVDPGIKVLGVEDYLKMALDESLSPEARATAAKKALELDTQKELGRNQRRRLTELAKDNN